MAVESLVYSIAIGLVSAFVGITLASLANGYRPAQAKDSAPPLGEGPIFMFDGDLMVDCNAAGRAVLARSAAQGNDKQKLLEFLSRYFQNIADKLADLPKLGAFADTAELNNGKMLLLQAEQGGGLTKITLLDPDIAEGHGVALAMSYRVMQTENDELRHAVSEAPILMWRESVDGSVIWGNKAYILLAASTLAQGRELSWPLQRLFDRSAVLQSADRQRQSVKLPTGKTQWFDLITQSDGDEILCYALPIDATVAAETSLRDFIQTLSKTFAQLPIGLAIFDKDRKLQMFNPALMELTTLPPDFLTRRPSMLAVLDAMRDRNLLPEPKNYQNWRQQVIEMERAAASGLFQENWVLPDGQTFRVTGRPHPNGGLALMIEDISDEMQRSRRYRSDLEISQSVIDHLDEAIAVFSQSGLLMWCNAAYSKLWLHDPASTLAEVSIRTATQHWKSLCAPTQLWRELDEYVHTVGLRKPWSQEVQLIDGRLMHCSIAPIAAGSTMIAFKTAVLPHVETAPAAITAVAATAAH